MADSGIDRRGGGADFCKNSYTPQLSLILYAVEGSGGACYSIFQPKYGRFFVFGTINRGGGGAAPSS